MVSVSNVVQAGDIYGALHQAVIDDPRVLSVRSNLQALQVEADGSISAYLPTVRGNGSAGKLNNSDPLSRDGTKSVYGLDISQPIPLFGHESTRVDLAHRVLLVEEAEVMRMEQSVLFEILESLLEYSMRKEILSVREKQVVAMSEQTSAAKKSLEGGGLKATESTMIQSSAIRTNVLFAQAKADFSIADSKVRQYFPDGIPLIHDMAVFLNYWPVLLSRESAIDAALLSSPSLLKAQAAAEQTQAEYAVAKTDLFPKISINLQWQEGSFGDASADSWGFFLNLDAPLYEGGANFTRSKSAAFKSSAAKESARHEYWQLLKRIEGAWISWKASSDMAQVFNETETLDSNVVSLTQDLLSAGAATRISFLQAQQSLFETVLKGIEYRWLRDVTYVRLLHESGLLSLNSAN